MSSSMDVLHIHGLTITESFLIIVKYLLVGATGDDGFPGRPGGPGVKGVSGPPGNPGVGGRSTITTSSSA